jgi:hypothetical protein
MASNRRYFAQQNLGATGAAGTTTILITAPGRGEKLVITHISVHNDTTAMTNIRIHKLTAGAWVAVIAEQPGAILTATVYWYHHDIVVHGGIVGVSDEVAYITLTGTLLNDVIGYYVEGYYISDEAWASEVH